MLIWLVSLALAAPSLRFVVDTAEPGMRTWWRPGDLVVGPREGDESPGVRPLVGPAPVRIPADPTGWTLVGEVCEDAPSASIALGEQTGTVVVEGSWDAPVLRVRRGAVVVAQLQMGKPVHPCQILVGQADEHPGLEILVAWRLGGADDDLRGLSVFRLSDLAASN